MLRLGHYQRYATLIAFFASLFVVAGWQLGQLALERCGAVSTAGTVNTLGWVALFLIGLAWTVTLLQRLDAYYQRRRVAEQLTSPRQDIGSVIDAVGGQVCPTGQRIWNPFDLAAWYYGRKDQRLKQSLGSLLIYSILFYTLYLAIHSTANAGSVAPYDLPSGGGQEFMPQQKVQIKKVVRKKYVINPLSTIKFAPPPIDQIDMKFQDDVRNEYVVGQGNDGSGAVGQGSGEGAGFGAGRGTGKVRFIRLVHSDRFWDKNLGIGGDLNMLAEYGLRTRQKVAEASETVTFDQLRSFPARRSPPLIYVCGAQKFTLTAAEQRVLREYVLERRGMILGDSFGPGFHQQFVAAMNAITGVPAVVIPRDDRIHLAPYRVPSLPIVVAHGGTAPLGWKVDGRWVAYCHPGALSDAWRDDHAGIRKEIYELCYQLGVNILFYAHREYNQWLMSQQ